MYKTPNNAVYGSLEKIAKLATLPIPKEIIKNISAPPTTNEQRKPTNQKGVSKKPSESQSVEMQSKATVALNTKPAYKRGTMETTDNTQKQLQDAILWSEILGKPVCKRRKRSYYGD